MSAAKMLADSTQADLSSAEEAGTVKRKKSSEKKKAKKRKFTVKKALKKKGSGNEESDDSDLDLQKDIKPIGAYMKDRGKMLEQMLHSIRGTSLQRALPDILKDIPFEDLKKRCMEQLEIMSKKRIHRILAGDDPSEISSSGTEDETSDEEQNKITAQEPQVDSTSFQLSSNTEPKREEKAVGHSPLIASYEEQHQDEEQGGNKDVSVTPGYANSENEGLFCAEEEEEGEIIEEKGDNSEHEGQDWEAENEGEVSISSKLCEELKQTAKLAVPRSIAPVLTQNQMELLELEMRARAIRSMLGSKLDES
ncbi:hypothetical protein ACJMK2_041486 [Sinanodonta woodiana]|uniref:Caspase activity and apoptosis inhibitor 1 n=1 Tax=Sinanodonta woodiana TaxID=1069815 RepID=A0ABD3W668_SINWO